jgi:biopolymer transport protein ExbB/TolQ
MTNDIPIISFFISLLNTSFENVIVILVVFLVMIWMFLKDLFSYKGNNHQDFKSILVSTGVLGTFIGIFIGLWGFNSGNVSDSVPVLLDGLKTAFITSIAGMFLAILLSIIQKSKNKNNSEDEITALNNISKQLEKLDFIDEKLMSLSDVKKNTEILPLINTKLDSIDTNIKSLSSDISGVKDELKINQKSLFEFLKEKLSEIDNSLKEAVQTLSKGATKEIINALQDVIKDFNSNLTEQFGDNFKKLNESVLNMIEWQDTYKNSVKEFEEQLKTTTENTNESNKNITKLIKEFTETNLKNLQDFISENNQALLENIEKINIKTDNNTNSLIEKVKDFSNEINNNLKESVEQNHQSNKETNDATTKNVENLIKVVSNFSNETNNALKESVKQNKNDNNKIKESLKSLFEETKSAVLTTENNAEVISEMTCNYSKIADISDKLETVINTNQNQIQNLEKNLKAFAEISNNSKGITNELKNFSNEVQDSLSTQSHALSKLTKDIQEQLPASLRELEISLTSLSQDFANNYEEFLNRFGEIKKNNN